MTPFPLLVVFGLGTLSAVLTISRRNPIHSALFLILTLLSVAASFLFLRADFLAMIQIILYAGAIMVLILFVVLLTAREELKRQRLTHRQSPVALLIGGALVAELCYMLFQRTPHSLPDVSFHSVRDLGEMLFKEYVFPFELASLLLLVALIATITIAKKEESR